MSILIKPSSVNGKIQAPASKSYMQRAIMASALTEGTSVLSNCSFCEDTLALLNIAQQLGAKIHQKETILEITGDFTSPTSILNCHESGLALRMTAPIVALLSTPTQIIGTGSLIHRPIDMISEALKQLKIEIKTSNGQLPLTISGPLLGGNIEIDGSKGSQLHTGLLMSLPLAKNNSTILVHHLTSKPYIEMTLEVLTAWNIEIIHHDFTEFIIAGNQHYKPTNFIIEGDWSSAAFMLVAGAIAGNITVNGLNKNSKQADAKIMEVIHQVGASIQYSNNSITVSKNELNGFDFDATNCPDLFPPLVALAVHCNSTSTIQGVSRLFNKESNRADSLVKEFTNLGANIKITDNQMIIKPSSLKPGIVDSHNDHRIVMATAISALGSDAGVEINGFDCINKSYPDFYTDLKTITQQ